MNTEITQQYKLYNWFSFIEYIDNFDMICHA